ncbi:MAG: phosphodiester glycosidase family protein [Schwartzia sp.]|nr:phosphodiester glycosidase family protein [Schwartzia sp. (in: firmicutes)]
MKIRFEWARRSLALLLLLLLLPAAVLAADLRGVRFGSSDERDRVVFDVSAAPRYEVKTERNGQRVIVEFAGLKDLGKVKPAIKSELIQRVTWQKNGQNLRVIFDLSEPADYVVKALKNPARVFIDFSKFFERETDWDPAPGLKAKTYFRRDGRGLLSAFFLDVDPAKYRLEPVLANGEVLGRQTVRGMSDDMQAAAAINASYFEPDGSFSGVVRMDGTVIGTTYFTRSALGIKANGRPFIAPVYYDATVRIGAASVRVSGVNIERGDNNLIIYNRYYNPTTETNRFGREFTVQNGRITKIQQANSVIPQDGYVISVHGSARDAFVRARVGDKVTLTEDLGPQWLNVPTIVSGGPMLVKNGKPHVTVAEEKFPEDIAVGRAPRTGLALLPNRHILLAVVDGRQSSSIGCTLDEFAELLVKFGAREAINFDGGGSSEMVIGGQIINNPSDGQERKVANALAVMKK